MMEVNYAAVVVAAVAVFVAGFVYYVMFGKQLEKLGSAAADREKPSPWLIPVELARSLVLAAVVAGLATNLDIAHLGGAALLGFALWVGFPIVLLAGSVFHENVSWRLAALHSGDWLVKLLLITVIVTVWT